MKIVSVIPLKKSIFRGELTYFTGLDVLPGDVVAVMLKSKKILALATSIEELRDEKSNIKNANFGLKKIVENKGNSVFLREYLESISDTAKYFSQNRNNCFASLLPGIFIENYEKIKKIEAQNHKEKKNFNNTNNLRTEKLLFQYRKEDRISVYKTLIRESFAKNKSIFIILPTQFDIEKFANQLSKGVEQFTFTIHGGTNAKKNLISYEKIITFSHPVLVLCTPSFLAIPRKDVGTIILEHENSNAYKTITKPHLDLRTFVEIYATKINARYILASDMLRLETIERKNADSIPPLYPLSFRIDFPGELAVVPKTREPNKKFKILPEENIEEIKRALKDKKNVFIFSLRKGLATMTLCKDCGETVSCKNCGAPLVLYLSHKNKKRMFACNRCEAEVDGDIVCSSCKSWNLIPLGIGTDTVYEELQKTFPKIDIFKLDKESAKTVAGAKKIIGEFEKSKGSILVGTEMAFYYLNNKIPLSIIASFDSLWSIPNYKMGEKIIQILFAIVENTFEKIIIQTKNEKDDAIQAIKSRNLLSFVRNELENRKKLDYPPFKRFIKITFLGNKEETIKAKRTIEEIFKEYSPEIFSGFIPQVKGKFKTNVLIKLDPEKWSLPELRDGSSVEKKLFQKLLSLPSSFEVFIDPEDLL